MPKPALFMLMALAASGAPRFAAAQDDPACAKFEDPMAYNACLAEHGPKAKDVANYDGVAPERPAAAPAEPARPIVQAQPRRYWSSATQHHGRLHMEFTVR